LLVGKTTLADALLASNGIISQRLAGKVKLRHFYMAVVQVKQCLCSEYGVCIM